jgi:hypothetical protein
VIRYSKSDDSKDVISYGRNDGNDRYDNYNDGDNDDSLVYDITADSSNCIDISNCTHIRAQ